MRPTTHAPIWRVASIAVLAAATLLTALAMATPAGATANAVTNDGTGYEDLQSAVDAAVEGDTLVVNENLLLHEQVTINESIIIDGQGHTLTTVFTKTDNSNNSAIGIIETEDVTIENLIVRGGESPVDSQLHGINVFDSQGVTLTDVEAQDFRTGVAVNSSEVTIDGIATSGNIWHAINVDQPVDSPATLTISGDNSHTENSPNPVSDFVDGENVAHIFVDDDTKDVTIDDVDGQYQMDTVAFRGAVATVGTLAAPLPAPTESTEVVGWDTGGYDEAGAWMFDRDQSTSTAFEFNQDEASIGDGALFVPPIGSNPSDKFIAEYFAQESMATLGSFSVDVLGGEGSDAFNPDHVYMNVYANFGESDPLKYYDCRYNAIADTWGDGEFATLTFDVTDVFDLNYDVATHGSSPHDCPAQPLAMGGDAVVRAIAINAGVSSASDDGLSVYFDNAVLSTEDAVTTFDFELVPHFSDVTDPEGVFFDAIQWMYESGLSQGTGGEVPAFNPQGIVTRQVMAAFLYRFAGSPEVEATEPYFSDVTDPEGTFYDAIQWMYESGISLGTGGEVPAFNPTASVSRQAMAAFMYRFVGEPEVEATEPYFSDVTDPEGIFFDAIQWMYESGVSQGTSEESPAYKPRADVTRQAMAAFLYRMPQLV